MRLVSLLALCGSLLLAGCAPGRSDLLGRVSAAPPPLSPDLRDSRNGLDVTYELGLPARVSAHLRAPDGRTWPIYEEQVRPTAGTYRLALDGTLPGPGPNERRALPDGDYRLLLKAEAPGGRVETAETLYQIRGADTQAPDVEDLTLLPDRVSPNSDAIDDVMRITYRLTKAARATAFVDRLLPDGTRRRVWTGEARKLDAGEQRLHWDGTNGGRPLPDGSYEFGIRARDAAGNVSESRRPITIEAGGVPEGKIIWARVGPKQIVRGNEVCADLTVRNIGTTVLRTQGPDPGYVYDSFNTYESIDNQAHLEHAGFWRVGLDWSGSNSLIGAKYPYRWGLGKDLPPGEETTVHGCVRVHNEHTRMIFFAALIQENVAIHDAGIGQVEIRVSP